MIDPGCFGHKRYDALDLAQAGEPADAREMPPLVYNELRKLAAFTLALDDQESNLPRPVAAACIGLSRWVNKRTRWRALPLVCALIVSIRHHEALRNRVRPGRTPVVFPSA